MKPALALFALAVLALSSCGGAGLDADSPVSLAAADPAILSNAATLIFSFSKNHTCKELVDLGPAEIGALIAPEGAPLQLLERSSREHVFGKVDPGIPIAFFVLASTKVDANAHVDLGQFRGSVFAMGCRDFAAASGTRHDLPLTLFSVGLR